MTNWTSDAISLWLEMASEAEILSYHQGLLRQSIECCQKLKMNAVEVRPVGSYYTRLQRYLKQLDGSCRQMAHGRGDSRWLRAGMFYARCKRLAQNTYAARNWKAFASLEQILEKGMRAADDLATRPTERRESMILPSNPANFLVPERPSSTWLDLPAKELWMPMPRLPQ